MDKGGGRWLLEISLPKTSLVSHHRSRAISLEIRFLPLSLAMLACAPPPKVWPMNEEGVDGGGRVRTGALRSTGLIDQLPPPPHPFQRTLSSREGGNGGPTKEVEEGDG